MTANDTWLTLGAAAVATGWRPEKIRSLARRGTIVRKRGNGRDWLYQVTPELIAARAADRADPSAGTPDDRVAARADPSAGTGEAARWQAVATALQDEVNELRHVLARAEERAAERAEASDRIAAAERAAREAVIGELRAALAWHRTPFWRRWWG